MFSLGSGSLSKLVGVHPDLVRVVKRAITLTEHDFSVIEGLRSVQRQEHLFNTGKSKTMKSRHLTGHAVDIAPYPFNGDFDEDGIPNIEDWDQYYIVAKAMKDAAILENVPVEWGGDWKTFKDGPHWQLSWKDYP